MRHTSNSLQQNRIETSEVKSEVKSDPEEKETPNINLIIETSKSDEVKDVVNTLVQTTSNVLSKEAKVVPTALPSTPINSMSGKLSFNDKDSVLDMGTNKSTEIIAPKTIERLESLYKKKKQQIKRQATTKQSNKTNSKQK